MEEEWLTPEEEKKWASMQSWKYQQATEEDSEERIKNELCKYSEKCGYCGKRAYQIAKAPSKVSVEIWKWYTTCYKCRESIQVIWLVDVNIHTLDYSLRFDTFEKLPDVLSEKYPFFNMTFKKIQNVEEYGNVCSKCKAYQGDYFIMEEYFEMAYSPETANKDYLEVELNDDERLYYSEPKLLEKMHHPKKGNYSSLCKDCYKLYKSGKI